MDADITVEKVIEHHTKTTNTVLFFPEKRRLVSCSDDGSFVVYCLETTKVLYQKKVEDSRWGNVNNISKWDSETFITLTSGGKVKAWNVADPNDKGRVFLVDSPTGRKYSNYYFSSRIDEDHFIVTNWGEDGELLVLSFSRACYVKKLKSIPVSAYSRIVVSKNYPKSFYFNCYYDRMKDNSVKLVNFETDTHDREFKNHKNQINTIDTFKNTQGDEILIIGGNHATVYLYNTNVTNTFNRYYKKIVGSYAIGFIQVFSSRYILAAERESGNLRCIDIMNDYKVLSEKKIHSASIQCIALLHPYIDVSEKSLRIATCSGDNSVKIVRIRGIQLPDDFEEKDLLERVQYLKFEYLESISSGEEKKGDDLIEFKVIGDVEPWILFKTFLI